MPNHQFHYFEDYHVGQTGVNRQPYPRRTITEADLVTFGGMTADYSSHHLDRHFMLASQYKERVAHGLLGSTVTVGLFSLSSPHIIGRDNPGAYLYNFAANYRKGLPIGDTVTVHWQVTGKDDNPPHRGFGLVKSAFQLVNQDDVCLYDGSIAILIRKSSASDARLQLKPGKPWQDLPEFWPDSDRIYYAEDFEIGKGAQSGGRTITEADIVNYVGFSGDYDARYIDIEYAKRDLFGERIAPGMMAFDIAFGMWTWQHYNQFKQPPSNFAGHLTDTVTFLAPVKVGDTVSCKYRVASCRNSKSKPRVSIVKFDLQVINQRNELVQEGSTAMMIPSREGLKR